MRAEQSAIVKYHVLILKLLVLWILSNAPLSGFAPEAVKAGVLVMPEPLKA
jgi:hypothetical protein